MATSVSVGDKMKASASWTNSIVAATAMFWRKAIAWPARGTSLKQQRLHAGLADLAREWPAAVGQCRGRAQPQIRFIAGLQAGEQDIASEQQD